MVASTCERGSSGESVFDDKTKGFADFTSTRKRKGDCHPTDSAVDHGSRKGVTFNGKVAVVLIPERAEYKVAKIERELWWSRSDYQSFHQSAFSELKLFSIYENINTREARKILYQPTPEESCTSQAQVGSRDRLRLPSAPGDDGDQADSAFATEPSVISSTECGVCPQGSLHLMRHKPSVAMDLCELDADEAESHLARSSHLRTETLPSSIHRQDAIVKVDRFDFLSLCVPIHQPQSLSTRERASGRRSARRQWGQASSSSSSDLLPTSNGLTFLLGLCSFTLPIFGYYIMHYCQ